MSSNTVQQYVSRSLSSGGKKALDMATSLAVSEGSSQLSKPLTGLVATTLSDALVGAGTLFLTEAPVGSAIRVGSEVFTVSAVASDVALTLDSAATVAASGVTAYTDESKCLRMSGDGACLVEVRNDGRLQVPLLRASFATGGNVDFLSFGTAAASQQGWIEVSTSAGTGYIHVFAAP